MTLSTTNKERVPDLPEWMFAFLIMSVTLLLSPLYLEYTFTTFAYVFETIAMFVIPIAIKIIEFTPSCVHGAKYLLEFVLELMLLPLGLRAA